MYCTIKRIRNTDMNPTNSSQGGDALGPVGPSTPQQNAQNTPSTPQAHTPQTAAANIIREQIDALYGNRESGHITSSSPRPNRAPHTSARTYLQQTTPARQTVALGRSENTPVAPATQLLDTQLHQAADEHNPYERTHTPHPQPQAEQWKAYHSAWQNYYQKYYQAYYHQRDQQNQAAEQPAHSDTSKAAYFTGKAPSTTSATAIPETDTADITKDEALFELRQKLLGKVRTQATKLRGSKHFIPVVAALSVILLFVFLQYNRVFIATVNAYVSPGSMDPQNIVIDPSSTTAVSADPRLIIPKINVDVPTVYGVGADHASQMTAMEKGVAHFSIPGANSRPGEIGNTVLSGHSSNDLFDSGEYKFIFAQLEKLNQGDTIYANYEGVRYSYVVTQKEVVLPTQVDKLIYPTNKPILTLITCTPLGTAEKRLLITAEQISPDPSAAATAPQGSGEVSNDPAGIPGNSPTLIERLFGAR